MLVTIPIQYTDLFEFLEAYRTSVGQGQYTIPCAEPLAAGQEVEIQFLVPVLGEVVSVFGQVVQPMGTTAVVSLRAEEGDGMARLEGFYRFIGRLVESMLVSGRFKVTANVPQGMSLSAGGAAGRAMGGNTGPVDTLVLGEPSHRGELNEDSLTGVLMELYRLKSTGILEVTGGTGRRLGFVKKGGIVQWLNDPVVEEECLGVLLARAGKLSEENLRKSLTMMNESGMQQGECLIEMGVLTFPKMVLALMTQVEIITRAIMTSGEGQFSFFELPALDRSFVNPPMRSPGFLFGHYKKRYASMKPEAIKEKCAPLLDRYVVVAEGVNWDDYRLNKKERGLTQVLIEKSYRFRQIFSVSTLGRSLTLVAVMALVELSILDFVDLEDKGHVHERWLKILRTKTTIQDGQNPFEILEIHWTSRTEQVEVAIKRLRKEYQGFGGGAELPPEVAAMCDQILSNCEAAYQKLASTATRAATRKQHYETQQLVNAADLLFKQGEMLMVRNEWPEVIDNFERAIELMPGEAKYRKYLQDAKARASGRSV